MNLLVTHPLNITTLVRTFWREISLTWFLTIIETALLVIRRLYDTRVYSKMRVSMCEAMSIRMKDRSVSSLNARLGMGRELVDFLETTAPEVMTSIIQLITSLVILYSFHPMLATFAFGAAVIMILLYGVFHRQFYRLNGAINQQVEKQVSVLEILYGAIFTILLGFILFNLWFAANEIDVSPGKIFSIVTYSWEFVDSALALPMTLQLWTRLSEITARINK